MKTKAENLPCIVVIDRLRQFITLTDACNYIGLPTNLLSQLPQIKSNLDYLPEDQRDQKYHLQKIKYFIENGIDKPIDIDCFCRDTRVYNWPVIIDGRHRYIAALLRKDKTIPAVYSGTVALKDYLTFKSNNKPGYTGNIL